MKNLINKIFCWFGHHDYEMEFPNKDTLEMRFKCKCCGKITHSIWET